MTEHFRKCRPRACLVAGGNFITFFRYHGWAFVGVCVTEGDIRYLRGESNCARWHLTAAAARRDGIG